MAWWHKDKAQKLLEGVYPWNELNNYEAELNKKEQIIENIDKAMVGITDYFVAKNCPSDFDWTKWFELSKKISNLRRERDEIILNSIKEYQFYLVLLSLFKYCLDILPSNLKQKFINNYGKELGVK